MMMRTMPYSLIEEKAKGQEKVIYTINYLLSNKELMSEDFISQEL